MALSRDDAEVADIFLNESESSSRYHRVERMFREDMSLILAAAVLEAAALRS